MTVAAQRRSSASKVTFAQVLTVRSFRMLYTAALLSGLGDAVSRLAVAILVFQRSRSPLLTAVAYALTYVPWLVTAGRLGALGDRLPARPLLVGCDVSRAFLGTALVVPGLPVPAILALAFGVGLGEPAFGSARSALLPELVDRVRYPTAIALMSTSSFFVRVVGLGFGGALVAAVGARNAIAVDVASFVLSALVIGVGLAGDPSAAANPLTRRRADHPLEARVPSGLALVSGNPQLRWLVLMASVTACSAAVAEASAIVVAAQHGGGSREAGLLAAAIPAGFVLASLATSRFLDARQRLRALPAMALLCAAGTIPVLFNPPLAGVAAFYALAALGAGCQLTANQLFVLAVPPQHRAKSFAVAQAALLSAQGIAITLAGALQSSVRPTTVVGGVAVVITVAVAALLVIKPDLDSLLSDPVGGPATEVVHDVSVGGSGDDRRHRRRRTFSGR